MNKKIQRTTVFMLAVGTVVLNPSSIQAISSDTSINNTIPSKRTSNITKGSVLEITLASGQNISTSIVNNPGGYEAVKVTTTGTKKLDSTDYERLKNSLIPNIDLSNASSDSIPAGAFSNATHLTSFKFPKNLISIESGSKSSLGAFYNCTGLTGNLVIPSTVTSIGNYAFYQCSGFTGSLTIPNSVTSIGSSSFSFCSGLTGNLNIPSSVTNIGSSAFNACRGLNGSLTIPNSVTSIGTSAFRDCSGLTGNLVIPNSVKSVGNYTFYGCSGLNGTLTIPDSVTSIGGYAFDGCSGLTGNLTIPNSVTSIGSEAFQNCSGFNGTLTIPNSVTSIGSYAFEGCKKLTGDLVIPNSVTLINSFTFKGCTGFDGSLVIPSSVTTIGNQAFYQCSGLEGDLVIPNSVKSIGSFAFFDCVGFDGKLVIGNSVTTIGNSAFQDCMALTGNLLLPDSITSIGTETFDAVSVDKIIIKNGEQFAGSDYRKSVIDVLLDENSSKTIIEMSHNFDTTGLWLDELGEKNNGKPKITDINDMGAIISLEIPTPYKESNISITKDGVLYTLPTINNGKYEFTETGRYEVRLVTDMGTTSTITFEVTHIDEPTLTLSKSTEDMTTSVVITVNASSLAGINYIELPTGNKIYSNNTTYTVTSNGTYTFVTEDSLGRLVTESITITNIGSVPTLTLTKSTENATNGTVKITARASSSSGISYIILPDGSKVSSSLATYTVSSNGVYTFVAMDKKDISATASISITNIDKNTPTTTISKSPDVEWSNQDVVVTITAKDEEI